MDLRYWSILLFFVSLLVVQAMCRASGHHGHHGHSGHHNQQGHASHPNHGHRVPTSVLHHGNVENNRNRPVTHVEKKGHGSKKTYVSGNEVAKATDAPDHNLNGR